MNANEIVDILLEGPMTPDEFIEGNPEMLHSLTIEWDRVGLDGGVPIYLWDSGCYTYIGTIRQSDSFFIPYEVNPDYIPGGVHRMRYVMASPVRYEEPLQAALALKKEWEKTRR